MKNNNIRSNQSLAYSFFVTTIMAFNDVRSQLEWNAQLSTANAPVPTEDTKFLRKVRALVAVQRDEKIDVAFFSPLDEHHRDHRTQSQQCRKAR